MDTTNNQQGACPFCGSWHIGRCPQIAEIEYHPNGTIKRVRYVEYMTRLAGDTLPPAALKEGE